MRKMIRKRGHGFMPGIRVVRVDLDVDHICAMTGLSPDELKTIRDRAPRGATMFGWVRQADGTLELQVLDAAKQLLDDAKSQC